MRFVPAVLGAACLALAWLGPLPEWARWSFTAHMAMHVTVVAVAAPLLALAVAGSRWDPTRRRPGLFAPAPASVLELFVVWAWHAPVLHHAARERVVFLVAEQGSFLLVGLLVWIAAFGGDRASEQNRAAAGVAGLLLTSMHMMLLGALLALAPRPLYIHGDTGPFGWTTLQDQHLGGVLMLLGGGTAYMIGGLYLLGRLLRNTSSAPASSAREGGGEP